MHTVSRLVTAIVVLFIATGCNDPTSSSLGRVCDLGTASGTAPIAAGFPSLDCESRLCLKTPTVIARQTTEPGAGEVGVCTETCFTDDDCEGGSSTSCPSGFACAV